MVTSVKCTVTTDLAEVRHRLETVLLPSELNYAFHSITGTRLNTQISQPIYMHKEREKGVYVHG